MIWTIEDVEGLFDFTSLTGQAPIDQGKMPQILPTFVKPELDHYAMRVAGDMLVPPGDPKFLHVGAGFTMQYEVAIDGKAVEPVGQNFGKIYAMPPGRHHVAITYATPGSKPEQKGARIKVFISDESTAIKHFALTQGGQMELDNTTLRIAAVERPLIMRRRITGLPPATVAVGFPQGYNYAFNPRSCSLVGAWIGEFLDIGPNAIDRGRYGALPLGDWVFQAPNVIALGDPGEGACRYTMMRQTSLDAAPSFHFTRGDVAYTLGGAVDMDGLALELTRDAPSGQPVMVGLPADAGDAVMVENSTADAARIVIP